MESTATNSDALDAATDAARRADAYEADLVRRVGAGDRGQPLIELYGRYARRLYGFGLHQLGDQGPAEELVQETFLRVWRSAGRFDASRGTVRAWIFSIARNAAIDLHRKRARRPVIAGGVHPEPVDDTNAVDDLVLSLTVRDALDTLPPAQREALELAYDAGMSQPEVAERLGVPLGTVKSRTFNALRALKVALSERGIDG